MEYARVWLSSISSPELSHTASAGKALRNIRPAALELEDGNQRIERLGWGDDPGRVFTDILGFDGLHLPRGVRRTG